MQELEANAENVKGVPLTLYLILPNLDTRV